LATTKIEKKNGKRKKLTKKTTELFGKEKMDFFFV